jgi:hypothetical protein
MTDAESKPAQDRSVAEVLAEAYDEPVEQFQAYTEDIPALDELEPVPEDEQSENDIDAF